VEAFGGACDFDSRRRVGGIRRVDGFRPAIEEEDETRALFVF